MALDPGTALAVVSLTFQAFAGCVKGFVLLSDAHSLGKDASFLRTMLNLEEYHFIQWAKRVGLTEPGAKLDPRLNQVLAAELIGQLQVLLGTNKLRERYKLELVVDQPTVFPNQYNGEDDDTTPVQRVLGQAVSNETRGEILARANLIQSKNILPKRLWWAAVDKQKFEILVRDVRAIVQGLWALLDPIQQDDAVQKIEQVLALAIEVSKDVKGLQGLQKALMESRGDTGRHAVNLATSAGIKAVRIEIEDEDGPDLTSDGGAPAQQMPISPGLNAKGRRDILLPPLSPHLLTNFAPNPNNSSRGIGLYSGVPVVIEYKYVSPKMKAKLKSRVENLAALLCTPKDSSFLTLHCLGFFEEVNCFVFVYSYPANPDSKGMAEESNNPTVPSQPLSLLDLLRDSNLQPSVTLRLAVALKMCRTLLALHTAGWLHKDIRSENILFFPFPGATSTSVLLSRPYFTGFTFSRIDSPTEISEQPSANPLHDIYRHRDALGDSSKPFGKYMDLYALGMVLIEVAEWRALKTLIRKFVDVTKPNVDVPLNQMAGLGNWLLKEKLESGVMQFRMGDVFGRAVEGCLREGGAQDATDGKKATQPLQDMVRKLDRCVV